MREYELWLDESGDFDAQTQSDIHKTPSLAGGILIPSGAITDAEIRCLADPDGCGGHAMEMSYSDAQRIVPDALEGVVNHGGRLVYFENQERIDDHTNRDLYLRVLASGLAQLVKALAVNGSFLLKITVAVYYVYDKQKGVLKPIEPEDYRAELKRYIQRAFEDTGFVLDPASRIALVVLSARQEARLALADYACNARLASQSQKYAPVRERLGALFSQALVFSVTTLPSVEIIRTRLATGDISGALMEYFTTPGRISRKRVFSEIMRRLSGLSYRLQRLAIRKFSAEIRTYAARETDFERSEALLVTVIDSLFSVLPDWGIDVQTDESLFWIYLSLADMYLREGDVIHARPVMDAMEKVIRSMNYRVENLVHLYFYRDKKALYEINAMDYAAAVQTMQATIDTMEALIGALSLDPLIESYYGGEQAMASEYLGDAYCMKIYAELFLQRQDEGLYERCLWADTERALSQYRYPGELERNQQYRSKAENEQGNCPEALEWLLRTQEISIEGADVTAACMWNGSETADNRKVWER